MVIWMCDNRKCSVRIRTISGTELIRQPREVHISLGSGTRFEFCSRECAETFVMERGLEGIQE